MIKTAERSKKRLEMPVINRGVKMTMIIACQVFSLLQFKITPDKENKLSYHLMFFRKFLGVNIA